MGEGGWDGSREAVGEGEREGSVAAISFAMRGEILVLGLVVWGGAGPGIWWRW